MSEEEMKVVLEHLEWSGKDISDMSNFTCRPSVIICCPYCYAPYQRGRHFTGCKLAEAISAPTTKST